MDGEIPENLSPLVPKPLDEVLVELGFRKCPSSKKKTQSISPLLPIPIEELRHLFGQLQADAQAEKKKSKDRLTIHQSKNKKPEVSNNVQKTITFKVPHRISQFKHNKENVINNSGKRINKRFSNDDPQKRHVRKVLFSLEETPIVPPKDIAFKGSRIPGISNKTDSKRTLNTMVKEARNTSKSTASKKVPTPMSLKKKLKLSSSSIDDFEKAEALCNVNTPSPETDVQRMQELMQKHQALTIELNAVSVEMVVVWQRIQRAMGTKTNGLRTRSPFIKAASVKRLNLLKSTLMRTVKEDLCIEDLDVKESGPIDAKMSQSITMYNAVRGHILRTPKASRGSLERGDTISTTVQKQCLMLMDTPKL